MKFRRSFDSKTDNLVLPSPVPDKPLVNGDHPIAQGVLKSQRSSSFSATSFRDFGSKEETFFDSQPWLESDCDDDFFSVNGDFTPSRGSTPVHHSFSAGTPRLNNTRFDDIIPGSKPQPKKVLSELFRDSIRSKPHKVMGTQDALNGKIEPKISVLGLPPRPANSTPYVSRADSVSSHERAPSDGDGRIEEGAMEPMRCCFPRMLSSRSFIMRKKTGSARSTVG